MISVPQTDHGYKWLKALSLFIRLVLISRKGKTYFANLCTKQQEQSIWQGRSRIWSKYLKTSLKFLRLMTSCWHPRQWRHAGKLTLQVKRFYIIVLSNSHPSWRKTGILVLLFSISKTRTRSYQSFFYKKIVYNKIVISLDYLNWCKGWYVYADITVLV